MEDDSERKPRESGRAGDGIGLDDLRDYYLDRIDGGKRRVIEAQLKDPDSQVSSFLRSLRRDWSVEPNLSAPEYPRSAELPQEDVEAAEARRRFAPRTSDQRHGPFRVIGQRRPSTPEGDRDGDGKGRS